MSDENKVDEAQAELMQKMASAVNTAKSQHEQIKTASPDDLDNPSDLLTNTIEGMNDQFRAEHFPEEHAKIAADREERLKKQAAADGADDDDEPSKEAAEGKSRETPVELRVEEEGVSYEIKEAIARGENPFYSFRKVAEELEDPNVVKGLNDYLESTEHLWKGAAHKLMLFGMNVGAMESAA